MWNLRCGRGLAFVLGAVLAAGFAPTVGAQAVRAEIVYDANQLTPEQFQRLPDGAVIVARGKRFTAAELRARARRNTEAFRTGMATVKLPERPDTDALRARFLQDQKNKLNAANARVRAQFAPHHMNKVAAATPTPPSGPAVPEITEIVGTVRPGAALYIKGKNFGYGGDVLLKGLPQGIVPLPLDTNNYLFPWLSDGVAVVVPEITGINDTAASIQVNVTNGLGSMQKPVTFWAADVIVFNVDVALLSCSQDATENRCDNSHGSFFGLHTENTLIEADALGCDKWAFTLHNGWTVYSSSYFQGGLYGEAGSTFHPAVGSMHYEWQVCWRVPGAGPYSGNFARYGGHLDIIGHLGVPW